MLKISYGLLKGKTISVNACGNRLLLRPTSSITKSVLFNVLTHNKEVGFSSIEGLKVIDMCCGTGSVGIEFLSLGADSVIFLDSNYSSLAVVSDNINSLGLKDRSTTALQKLPCSINAEKIDVIFFDPPYKDKTILKDQLKNMFGTETNGHSDNKIESNESKSVLTNNGVLVVEMSRLCKEVEQFGLIKVLVKNVNNKTKLVFYKQGKI
ncbi:MAG: RsmD family RNA methyltransferase [Alphaproteobacteria bacterium]|nr:RsmD family RNA methyltransferase [Rickettsiales bacterium]